MTTCYAHLAPEHNQGVLGKLVSPQQKALNQLTTISLTAMDGNTEIEICLVK